MLAGIAVAGSLLAASVTSVAFVADAAAAPPPQRGYEMVSPVEKAAADVVAGVGAGPDGNSLVYLSFGSFPGTSSADVGTYYRSTRTATGWTTATMSPPQVLPDRTSFMSAINAQDFTADYATIFATGTNRDTPLLPEDVNESVDVYTSSDGDVARWLTPGMVPGQEGPAVFAGRSDDGRVVVFESNRQFVPGVAGDPGRDAFGDPPHLRQVYEVADGETRLVSALPDGSVSAGGAKLGAGHTFELSNSPGDRSAVSADGSRIFFTADGQLYARIDGTRTVLISASQVTGSVGDPATDGAQFGGASRDGHYVTFTSRTPLVDGAIDGGLYGYDVDSDQLRLLSEGDMAAPSTTVRTAPDGSRVYFASYHELQGEGVEGTPNLWVARADGATHFIGTLDGGADWKLVLGSGEDASTSAITADGTRLAFESAARFGRYDSGGTSEVYVYDDTTQTTTCVSCPSGGADPTDRATLRDPANNIGSVPRSFTTDGDLFFESPERLSEADTDDKVDVYEYTGGRAVLMSPGTSTDTHYVDNSADGSTVFLRTRDALVPADTDPGYADVYAARVGGGFPDATPPADCVGSACRPAPSPEPGAPAAPPTVFALDDVPGTAPQPRTTFAVGAVSAARRSAFARTGRLALQVRVSDAAVVTATGRAQIGRKRVTVATGSINKLAAGRATLTVRLTSTARRALARSGRLTIRLTVACSDTTRTAHATLVLHHAKTTKKGR